MCNYALSILVQSILGEGYVIEMYRHHNDKATAYVLYKKEKVDKRTVWDKDEACADDPLILRKEAVEDMAKEIIYR